MKINYKNGSTHYIDARMMQVPAIEELIQKLKLENPECEKVVEIGTAFGGLTNLLCDYFKEVLTFDNLDLSPNFYNHKNMKTFLCDCHDMNNLKNILLPVVKDEKPIIYFIDGGNKALELNMISILCKDSDILMVHDFSLDASDFGNRGRFIWNCCEITEADINLNQVKRHETLFNFGLNYAWGIYKLK